MYIENDQVLCSECDTVLDSVETGFDDEGRPYKLIPEKFFDTDCPFCGEILSVDCGMSSDAEQQWERRQMGIDY